MEQRDLLTAVALPADAVSWWTANSTASDAMGLNNATLYNVTYATGEVGKAFSFNGTNGWAALGNPSSLAFTQSFTIEGWIKVNGLPTNYNFGSIMFRGDDRGGLDPYSLDVLPDGQLRFEVCSGSGTADLYASVPTGQFVHVAATLDDASGLMTLYENGAVVAQTTTTVRPFGALDPTQEPGVGIGNSNALDNYDVPFNGLIDELTVYNRALTAGEVLSIDKAGSSGKIISPIAVSDPSVVDGSGGATTPLTFTITRTGSLSGSLTVNWATADDTAIAGTDYVAASGTVTFADGQATQTLQVTTIDNNNINPNLDFKLIATPSGGTSIMGLGTIVNDDAAISVSSASAVEGSNTLKNLGAFIDNGSGGLSTARSSLLGPDGNFYVVSAGTNAVLRYDQTGEFIDAFVPSGSGGLSNPEDLAFGPDGNLYVSSVGNGEVLSYNGSTGAFIGVVASGLSTTGGIGIAFGPDGNLYIANQSTNEVLQYNLSTATLSSFVTAGSGGLSAPRNALFGPDGNLYVSSNGTHQILRYDGQTGAFLGVFATTGSTPGPTWMEFGSDGELYVAVRTASSGTDVSIQRYNATTGAFVDSFALGRDGWSFSFGPNGVIYDSSNSAGGFVDLIGPSSVAGFTVSLAAASVGTTTVSYSAADGTALAGRDYVATSGTLTFAPGETSKTIVVPTLDDGTADPTRGFTVNLSNPTGGAIVTGQGIGTILDDTKFYVVDGGAQTYQYASAGAALGNDALGDTAPRGIATTAAGTTEWVVDANKNVYVYSTGGALVGSWSAGGLSSSANITGIATNGTDIWLVDAYSDKVYKFTGAASRLSGSQTATSSFNLAGGKNADPNPQDIVTDGTSFWVVDGTKLKVFKYTLSGSLLGSWAIDPADAHPTGITINPNNVSDIWIVDNGTDEVYQYIGSASRTSGSQNASATFALNPYDTNPQGIADPPPADMLLTPTTATVGANDVPLQLPPVSPAGNTPPALVASAIDALARTDQQAQVAASDALFASYALPEEDDLLA